MHSRHIPHLAASIIGLSAILHTSAVAFQAMKLAGAAYLVYLSYKMWKDNGSISFNDSDQKDDFVGIAVKGFFINILNPKLSIFFLAFLPLFVSTGNKTSTIQMLILGSIFMGMTLAVFVIYGISANAVRLRAEKSPSVIKYIQKSFALIFVGLGVKLALSDR